MAKFDDQLNRMAFLMEYRNSRKNDNLSNIEFHANGADGKVYGIIKEGSKYYIKTTEKGKENISESYDYVNGFMNRSENAYSSYNEATKQLELKLMNLNEAYGKHEDVSVVDFKRNEKAMAQLTEEARKELNRAQQILENSTKIGMNNTGDPESKGKETDPVAAGDPFTNGAKAELDKDPKFNGTVKGATEHTDVKNVDSDLQSDKNKTANSGAEKDYKDAHDDLEGDGVADKKPAGGKVVKVNEDIDYGVEDEAYQDLKNEYDEPEYDEPEENEIAGVEEPELDVEPEDAEGELGAEPEDIEPDFDALLEELQNSIALDGPDGQEPIATDTLGEKVKAEESGEEALKGPKGNGEHISWDKMNKKIDALTEAVYQKMVGKKVIKESLEDKIERMVNEEVTKLNVWGKHPRYQKEPMTTPENKEVMKGTADRDWNDDSAKGSQAYGKKIGSSAPYTEVVELLTDQVLTQIKESLGLKKK